MSKNGINNNTETYFNILLQSRFVQKLLKSGMKTPVLVISSIVIFLIRLAGDSLLFFLDRFDTPVGIFWKLLTSFFLLLLLFFIFFREFYYKTDINDSDKFTDYTTDNYFIELRRILILTAILITSYIISNSFNLKTGEPDNLFIMFLSEILSIYSIIVCFILIRFLYGWLLFRRHKRTKLYLNILRNGLQYFILVELLTNLFKFLNNSVVEVLTIVIIVFMLIIVFLITKKNSWIVLLSKNNKLKLLWLTLLGIIICLIPANSGLVYQSNLHKSLLFFLPGTASGVGISFLFASVYFLRLFFAVVVSLPTSGIVERRTTEISSLTYLNKLIAETINYENLLQTVTDLAMNSIGGIAAWTELYLNERTRPEQTNSPGTLSLPINGLSYSSPLKWLKPGSIQTIIGTKNIEAPLIEKLDEKYKLREYLRIMDKPLLVDSIIEHPPIIEQNRRDRKSEQSVIEFKIQDLNWNLIPGARALIAVPLYSRDERIGTLVVVSDTEYGYETDDVKVLTAFSDNVSVAFENARLFQDSVEKERYRRELMLAREIEEKLLPQALPDIPGYSLSAFSVPAEEVGGDYYDVVKLKTGKTCILIGDVSGKGIAAAFLMAQLKGVVLAVAPESTGAVDILRRINNTLYGSIDKQMYITLCSLVIDNANINETDASGTDVSGRISIARAGHMPIISKQSNITKLITPKGIGIGLAEASIFGENIEEIELELERGDICLLFTDGVNELKNERYEEFGINSLKQILNMSVPMNIGTDASRTNVNVDYLLSEIKLRLKIFAGADAYGNVFQHDDMTIVALGYNGINH